VYQDRKDGISELEGISISIDDIIDAFNLHKTRNIRGYDSMSCNNLGNCLNESMNKLIYKLFNLIMISGNVPENFNTSIIVPIKKNRKIKTFELNNLRPISIY
jgi:hypothetical protein